MNKENEKEMIYKRELLAEYRRWQNYCTTTWIGIVAFSITQYDSISNVLVVFSIIGGIILLVLIAFLSVKITRLLNEIRRL